MSLRREATASEPIFDVSEHLPPPIRAEDVFGDSKPLTLDIGFGEGEFLFELSRRMPDFNHIGVEVKKERFKKAVKTVRREGAGNVKLIHLDGAMAVELFAPQTFDRIHINFPDPWPKDRHRKHRIINAGFVELLGSVIKSGGGLEIASDHDEYMEGAKESVERCGQFQSAAGAMPLLSYPGDRPRTRFETIFRERGETVKYLIYEKKGAAFSRG